MKLLHLFEFMDKAWLPEGLAATMREILSCGNSPPFRPYYPWIADEVERLVAREGYENVVELGAGSAPISRLLAARPRLQGVRLSVCDGRPDAATFEHLRQLYPKRVFPIFEPLDFSQPRRWPPRTLLVLSGTLHHLPTELRRKTFLNLVQSADGVLVVEPLRRNLASIGLVFLSTVPALVLPLVYARRPGILRRLFWCWICPAAPLMFWWDGIASALRMWTAREWEPILVRFGSYRVFHSVFCQLVFVSQRRELSLS